MKKNLCIIGLIMGVIALSGCSSKSKDDVDLREDYVGSYTLNITSDVYMTNGSKTIKYPLDASNKSFVLTLNKDNKSKLNYSGYYGEGTVTLSNNTLVFDKPKISVTNYDQGIYLQIDFENLPIKKNNNTLEWITTVVGGAVSVNGGSSTNAVAISGTMSNKALKK